MLGVIRILEYLTFQPNPLRIRVVKNQSLLLVPRGGGHFGQKGGEKKKL